MVLLLNTSEPIMIMIYILIIAGLIFVAKETKNSFLIFIPMFCVIGLLINHSVMLEQVANNQELIGELYRCMGMDLIMLLLTFISYLWVDDLAAKKYNKKSYDDSLSWFWEKL